MRTISDVTLGSRVRAPWILAPLAAAILFTMLPVPCAQGEELTLSLDEAIRIALSENKTLEIARHEEEVAKARASQARAAFLPRIGGSASYTRLDEAPYMDASQFGEIFEPLMVPFDFLVDEGVLDPSTLDGLSGGGADKIYLGDDDVYRMSLTFQQPIFAGGALWGVYGAAKHSARAESWRRVRVEDETIFGVTEAYVNLIGAREALVVMEQAVVQMQKHVSDVTSFFEAGMALESDLMLARVRAANVELGQNRAEHAVQLATAALSFAMGIDIETTIVPLDDLESSKSLEPDLDSWTGLAIEARPDLLAMRETAEVAGKGLMIARSEFSPRLVAAGSYNWDRPNREYQPEFYENWSVTIALELNIFDWGGRWNRVREAKLRQLQAERGLDVIEDAVRLEVKQSILMHDESVRALEIASDAVEQAREAMRITRESFRNGMSTNSQVLDAQQSLITTEMERVRALAGLRMAEAELELATGVNHQ